MLLNLIRNKNPASTHSGQVIREFHCLITCTPIIILTEQYAFKSESVKMVLFSMVLGRYLTTVHETLLYSIREQVFYIHESNACLSLSTCRRTEDRERLQLRGETEIEGTLTALHN